RGDWRNRAARAGLLLRHCGGSRRSDELHAGRARSSRLVDQGGMNSRARPPAAASLAADRSCSSGGLEVLRPALRRNVARNNLARTLLRNEVHAELALLACARLFLIERFFLGYLGFQLCHRGLHRSCDLVAVNAAGCSKFPSPATAAISLFAVPP